VIVVFASKIAVRSDLVSFVLFEKKGLLVEVFLEDGFDAFKRVRRDTQRSGASGFEAIWGVAFPQAHDAETGSEALFGMGFALEDSAEELLCVGAIFFCPMDDPGGSPLQIALVALGHVLGQGRKASLAVASLMAGYSFIFEEDLQGGGRQADIDLLSDKLVGNAIVVAIHLDMVVDVDSGLFPLRILIRS
jgi:hypothetical protein